MGESLNPDVNFSEDKHISAKPVLFLQGGGKREEKALLYTPIFSGGKVYVRTKPEAEPNILPSFSRWYGKIISFHVFFCCFRKKKKQHASDHRKKSWMPVREEERVRVWWWHCCLFCQHPIHHKYCPSHVLAHGGWQKLGWLCWEQAVSWLSNLFRHFQATGAVVETFRLMISHDIVQGCAKKLILVQHCRIQLTLHGHGAVPQVYLCTAPSPHPPQGPVQPHRSAVRGSYAFFPSIELNIKFIINAGTSVWLESGTFSQVSHISLITLSIY